LRRIQVSALPTIARALGVSIEELIGEPVTTAMRGPAPKLQQQLERITRLPKGTAAIRHADDRYRAATAGGWPLNKNPAGEGGASAGALHSIYMAGLVALARPIFCITKIAASKAKYTTPSIAR